MDWSHAGLIEIAIVFGIVLGLAVFDLVRLRQSMRRDAETAKANKSCADDAAPRDERDAASSIE